MKGFVQWVFGLLWQAGEYVMNTLMNVFNMDMSYFEQSVPVSTVIFDIMLGVGWAFLLGNLVFQAAKTMMSGLGFEGEDPKMLATRTFVFAFLLLANRQICDIGLGIGSTMVTLLQVPNSVILPELEESMFGIDASWIIVIIVGIIIVFQLIKFFFEVGERYVIVAVLTVMAPLAFAMGGSKNTADIFKGWARMYGSMCLMMVLNVVFMKFIISAMAAFPRGLDIFPWLILMVALARVARKIDNVIARIGLNPAITGDGLGRGLPGMLAVMVGQSLVSTVVKGKIGAGMAGAKAATGAASGFTSMFTGRARPAPSPINTATAGTSQGTNSQSSTAQTAQQQTQGGTQQNTFNSQSGAITRASAGSTQPVNTDRGKNTPVAKQPAPSKTVDSKAAHQNSGVNSVDSNNEHNSHKQGVPSNPPIQHSAEGTMPIDTKQAVAQKPVSRNSAPADTSQPIQAVVSNAGKPIEAGQPSPVNTSGHLQTERQQPAQSSVAHNGGMTPVQVQAQQTPHPQLSGQSSQHGSQPKSNVVATQQVQTQANHQARSNHAGSAGATVAAGGQQTPLQTQPSRAVQSKSPSAPQKSGVSPIQSNLTGQRIEKPDKKFRLSKDKSPKPTHKTMKPQVPAPIDPSSNFQKQLGKTGDKPHE